MGLPHETEGDFSLIVEYASKAEEIGFDSLVLADHVFFENEVLTTLAAVAMRTRKIELVPFVLDGNRRDPATLAHATATLDRLSNGRLVLGIGRGVWNEAYYGFDVEEPVSRMEETVVLLKRFWTGEEVTRSSRFFKFNKAQSMKARPLQSPHPPIWMACFGERMKRIAQMLGDGFITQNMPPWLLEKTISEARARRASGTHGFEAVYGAMPMAISKDREEARKLVEPSARGFLVRHADRLCTELGYDIPWSTPMEVPGKVLDECFIFGTPSDVENRIEEYMVTGVDHLVFQQVLPVGRESLEMLSKIIIRFR